MDDKEIKIINTTIPLTEKELDEYFDDMESYLFCIDLEKSEYEGKQLLNYIYNSGMNANLVADNMTDKLANILVEYIATDKLINIISLNEIWLDIIHKYLFDISSDNEEYNKFVENFISNNQDILKELISILCSLQLFLVKEIFEEEYNDKDYTLSEIKEFDKIGRNIISLRNSINFWELFDKLDEIENIKTAKYKEFEDTAFEGKKIANFFLNEFNPLGLMFVLSHCDNKDIEEIKKKLEVK